MTKPGEATYLYCVVESAARPAVSRAPAGLPGTARPRALPLADGLWLIAAAAPIERYGAAEIERGLKDLDWVARIAVTHEKVVEHFRRVGTVVPMKLFTLFTGEERALSHLRRSRRRLARLLTRIRGAAEWGVRVRLDEVRARRSGGERALAGAGPVQSGTRFLLLKKSQQDAVTEAARRASADVGRLFEVLSRQAREARRLAIPPGESGTRLLLDAAFLVADERALAFRERVEAAQARLAGLGLDFTLSGPWPPYNFIS